MKNSNTHTIYILYTYYYTTTTNNNANANNSNTSRSSIHTNQCIIHIYIHMDIGQKPIVIMFFLNQHPLASYPIGYLRVPISATSSKIKLFMLPGVPWQISPDMGE